MAELGYGIANIWIPRGVAFGQWATFHSCALVTLVILAVAAFVLYAKVFFKRERILQVEDIFKQRGPWLGCLFIAGLAQLVLCMIFFFAIVRRITLESVVAAFATGFVEGCITIFIWWILSLVVALLRLLPPRVKYVPWPVHLVKVRRDRSIRED